MLKLVIDARMLRSSGIGSYLQSIIPLISAEYDITLLISDKDIDICSRCSNVRAIACSSPIYSIREQLELPLKIPACDIFWSPHYNVPLLPIRARKRLVTIHDVFHLAFFGSLTLAQKFYAKLMLRSAVRSSDRIITVSNFSKSEIKKHLNADESRVRVIYNGINTEDHRVLNRNDFLDTEKKIGLPDKYILFVGNVKPNKNLKRLLTSCRGLFDKELKDLKLVIAGKKEGFITGDREVFEMFENEPLLNEQIIFTGYVENEALPVIYNRASLLVFPSLYEGFGLPPLEAMACGCPVIVSNTASLPEVCGEAAYYVDPHSVESITEGIRKVISDETLRKSLIELGHKRVELFSREKSAREHLQVFKDVLEHDRP